MSTTSIRARPMNFSRDRSNRPLARQVNIDPNDPNANDELINILNAYSMNDLLELQENENLKQISIAQKFQDFYQLKNRTTSIADKDSIFLETINEAIKAKEESKEEEPSPYNNEVTEDEEIKNKSFADNNNDDDETGDAEFELSDDLTQEMTQFLTQECNQKKDLVDQISGNNNNARVPKAALNKNVNEFVPGFGTLSGGGNTTLGPIIEEKSAETAAPEIKCTTNIPHSPSNSSVSSAASSINTNPGILSPSVLTQPPSITNSPPPTASTPIVDINPYLQTIQLLPTPSYWNNALITTSNPNMASASVPVQQLQPLPMQPMQPIQANYVNFTGVPAMPLAYPVIMVQQLPLQPMSIPNINLFSPPQTAVSVPNTNQFSPNNNTVTQPIPTQATEQKDDGQQYHYNQNDNNQTQFAPSKTKKFEAKFNNHAKGNFYISKEKIGEMIAKAAEQFDTEEKNDEKLAFGHYKESVAMSINDKQIDGIFETEDGKLMIIINIDLHFKSNPSDVMYLIAQENHPDFRARVRWCIIDFMSAQQILSKYGITHKDLPKSSRNMPWFKNGINRAPVGFKWDQVQRMTRNTHFKSLPKKTSKRDQKNNQKNMYKARISEQRLKYYVEQSLLDDSLPIVPVVVIKGKNQCIEWKRFVQIEDDNGYRQYVGISLKFYKDNKQCPWKIECMDYDSGRVYYQHRLASLPTDSPHNYSYDKVSGCITTSMLDIYDANRGNHRGNYRNNNYNNNYNNYNRRYDGRY